MGGIISAELDTLISKIRTAPGILRGIRRDAAKEMKDYAEQRKRLGEYVQAVQLLREDQIAHTLIGKHGYLVLLQDELALEFNELHRVLEEYTKFFQYTKQLAQILDRIDNKDPTRSKQLESGIDALFRIIENGFQQILGSIAGIESFSIGSMLQNAVDKASQVQDVGTLANNARKDATKERREMKALKSALKQLSQHTSQETWAKTATLLNLSGATKGQSVTEHLSAFAKELYDLAAHIITLLNETRESIEKITLGTDANQYSIRSITVQRYPSVRHLALPRKQGGFGMPMAPIAGASESALQRITKVTVGLQSTYQAGLKQLESECRIFMSSVEHQMR